METCKKLQFFFTKIFYTSHLLVNVHSIEYVFTYGLNFMFKSIAPVFLQNLKRKNSFSVAVHKNVLKGLWNQIVLVKIRERV